MSKTKLLYADDDKVNREVFSLLLKKNNDIELILVPSGEEAWETFQREKPNLVILDLYMPGMNGIQVMMKIRQIDDKIPVIAITGAAFDDDGEDIHELDFTEIYHKPVNEEKIKEIIDKHGNYSP